jgi:hypothetical protein
LNLNVVAEKRQRNNPAVCVGTGSELRAASRRGRKRVETGRSFFRCPEGIVAQEISRFAAT